MNKFTTQLSHCKYRVTFAPSPEMLKS